MDPNNLSWPTMELSMGHLSPPIAHQTSAALCITLWAPLDLHLTTNHPKLIGRKHGAHIGTLGANRGYKVADNKRLWVYGPWGSEWAQQVLLSIIQVK